MFHVKHIKEDIQMNEAKTLVMRGNVVDIIQRKTYGAELLIRDGRIERIMPTGREEGSFLLPGFIDAHVHIESAMVTPAAFVNEVVRHGSIGAVADPHEIANVMGTAGIDYMIENAKDIPFYMWFGVPSCVPATPWETSGATIDATETARLLRREDVRFLAEMMNVPGVLNGDPEVMGKIEAARAVGKPVDGHFPLAAGDALAKYIQAGVSTDHETISLEEGREKCRLGMHVLIREGSAAKNFDALHPLLREYPELVMFCTDDAHPGFLREGHIDRLVRKALELGYDLYDVLRAASYNPAMHYKIPMEFLREGDSADFIQVNNLAEWKVLATYIQGQCVFDGNDCTLPYSIPTPCNHFHARPISFEQLEVKAKGKQMRVIVCEDRSLVTQEEILPVRTFDGFVEADPQQDLLKLVVVNRYHTAPPVVAFIRGMGLRLGAVAQSIAHDSHNIIAVGATDFELTQAINAVIRAKGGIAVSCMDEVSFLPLPIGGLMSDRPLAEVCRRYQEIEAKIKCLGTPMESLQMTLSFMALLVIPALKLSDKGLFDGERCQFTSLFI